MRLFMLALLAFVVVLGVVSPAPVEAQATGTAAVSSASAAQDVPKLDVDIDVNEGASDGGKWYANPVWIAIGGLALVLFIALIVMAGKGGGTTVVRG